MSIKKQTDNSSKDFIEYMASFKNVHDIINIDSSDSSSDEIQIVKELTVRTENHRCDLCCEGDFLVDKLLRFGGLINEKYKFVCDKCDKNFEYESAMKKHYAQCKGLVSSQNGDTSIVKEHQLKLCSVCLKTFKSQGGLTKHMNSAHSGLTHTCELCKAVFSNFTQFRHHCFSHQKKKMNYVCTHCNKKFYYSASLRKHNEKKHFV